MKNFGIKYSSQYVTDICLFDLHNLMTKFLKYITAIILIVQILRVFTLRLMLFVV